MRRDILLVSELLGPKVVIFQVWLHSVPHCMKTSDIVLQDSKTVTQPVIKIQKSLASETTSNLNDRKV